MTELRVPRRVRFGAIRLPRFNGSHLGRCVAALLVVASLPLWLLAAFVVWSEIGRPIFFRQTRSGLEGRPFSICKFRTMRDTRGTDGTLLPDVLRETPATRLMRAWRLDELPQLLAITRGDMAFVGPRPLLPVTIAGFGDRGIVRGAVLPGLTGWSQVNGNTRLSNLEKLSLDLWYVRNRTAALDARILLSTGLVLVRGERLGEGNIALAAAELNEGNVSMPAGGTL